MLIQKSETCVSAHSHPIQIFQIYLMRDNHQNADDESSNRFRLEVESSNVGEHQDDWWSLNAKCVELILTLQFENEINRWISFIITVVSTFVVHDCCIRQLPHLIILRGFCNNLQFIFNKVQFFAILWPASKSEIALMLVVGPLAEAKFFAMSLMHTWNNTCNSANAVNNAIDKLAVTDTVKDAEIGNNYTWKIFENFSQAHCELKSLISGSHKWLALTWKFLILS